MTAAHEPVRSIRGLPPPHDLDAEGAVISACVLDPGAYDIVAALGLVHTHFYSTANARIFLAISELRARDEPVDVVTVAGYLRSIDALQQIGGTPYLAQVVDTAPAVANVASYARIVIDKGRLRMVVATMRSFASEAYGQVEDTQQFLEAAEVAISEIVRADGRTSGPEMIGKAAARALERVSDAQRQNKPMAGVPFGLERVDRRTKGMMAGNLFVVAARPGMGKTAFVLDAAAHVADRSVTSDDPVSVAFFSLEMTSEELAMRAVASHERINGQRLRSFEITAREWGPFTDGVVWAQKLPLYVDDTPNLDHLAIRSRSRRLSADLEREGKPPLGLIVVDYLQIMGTGVRSRGQNREEYVADNARGLKSLAKDLRVPVLACAQLNRAPDQRASKDRRPQLSDLRESGAIEQEADVIMFLYRDEYYFPESPDRGIAEVIIAKQRSGPTGIVKTRYTPEYTRFDNLADETYEFDEYENLLDFEDGGAG